MQRHRQRGQRPNPRRWGDRVSESIEKEFAVHQAICDQRYKSIEEKLESGKGRMQKIEIQLYIVIAAILFGPGVAADLVKKLLGL